MKKKKKYISILFTFLFVMYPLTVIVGIIISIKPTLFTPARLEKILPENKKIVIIRNGKALDVKVGMELEDGDIIKNASDTTLEIFIKAFQVTADGIILKHVKLILDKDSKAEISKFGIKYEKYGKISVKTRKYSFSVETKYVKAGTKGTEFLVSVEPDDRGAVKSPDDKVSIIVAEGTIWVKSKGEYWDQIELTSPGRCVIYGKSPPKEDFIPDDEVEKAFKKVREIQREPAKHEFFWDTGIVGITYEWYVKLKLNQLVKHQKNYNLTHAAHTHDLSDLKNFKPGSLNIEIVSANANCFEAELRHPKIPGYMWTVDCDRNIGLVKEDPNLVSKFETQFTIIIILFLTVSIFLFVRIVRKRLKD